MCQICVFRHIFPTGFGVSNGGRALPGHGMGVTIRRGLFLFFAGALLSVCVPSGALAIVGGNFKEGDTSPYVKLQAYSTVGNIVTRFECSGTLISARHVVTAAHCFTDERDVLLPGLRAEIVVSDLTGTQSSYA